MAEQVRAPAAELVVRLSVMLVLPLGDNQAAEAAKTVRQVVQEAIEAELARDRARGLTGVPALELVALAEP